MNTKLERALANAQNSDIVRDLLHNTGADPEFTGSPLCSLTAMHLLVFAGLDQSLLDIAVRDAWVSLNSIQRWQVRRLVMRSKALRPSIDGDGTRRLHPYVALIMQSRVNPRYVLTLGHPNAARGIRVFAIDSGQEPEGCFIMEEPNFSLPDGLEAKTPLEWYYRYWLSNRQFLATYLAKYSAVPAGDDTPAAGLPRVFSLYRPPVTDQTMVDRVEVHGAGSTAKVIRTGPGAPESAEAAEMTVEELATVVAELLAS